MMLRSKIYDILMIFLIVGYTALVLIQFGLDGQDFYDGIQSSVFIAELCILGVFVIEIFLHVVAFRLLYLKDYWNVLDIFIIMLSITFVLLDILLD